MVRILERSDLVPDHHQLVVEAPQVARTVQPGQFVILRPDEQSERIPISVSDFDRAAGTVTCVFLEAGATTMKLARLRAGDTLPTFMGPLGTPSEIGGVGRDGGPGTVVCCGGCYGIGRSIRWCGRTRRRAIGSSASWKPTAIGCSTGSTNIAPWRTRSTS